MASYKYLLNILDRTGQSWHENVRRADALALCRFMLDHGEIVFEVVREALVGSYYPKELMKERYELIKRAQALTDSPRCRFLQKGTEPWTKQELALALEEVVRADPSLAPPSPGPWDRVQTLLDLSKSGESRLQAVRLVGKQVYAAIGGFDNDHKPTLQVARIGIPDGAPNYLAKTIITLPPSPLPGRASAGSWINFVTGLAVGKDEIYVGTQTDGIYAFPVSGAAARRIGTAQSLPADHISALTFLDGKLYAGMRNGYLVAYDPADGRCNVLASSQRKEKLSPFDDGAAFDVPCLVADPERKRILFVLYQGMPSTANKTDGIWDYSVKTRAFSQRARLWRNANLSHASGVRAVACFSAPVADLSFPLICIATGRRCWPMPTRSVPTSRRPM